MELFTLTSPLLLVLLLSGTSVVSSTTFTFLNNCTYTVWPGVSPDAGQPMLATGGFVLAPGQSTVLNPPLNWSGRFWGRTGCSFDASNVFGSCATGDCGGRLQCDGTGGSTPVTLAEFTLGSKDFYDVSLVDGYNIPLTITSTGGIGNCSTAGCTSNLNGACPSQLQIESAGQVVACRSACDAFATPQYCCTGAFSTPQTCSPSSFSKIFKSACPTAYSYAYDDPSSTFTCTSATDYTITLCPRGTG